ncbi:triphosphoribosyl-dephospho-CoA synthase MdcB [Massilia brevitalea]|uniref:triphosphoribosyl-dephospho-CoA synthase MdcB n=1 Tax=Massilia brevitalea TaxID=442526 RepID=UPI0027384208|nr:triphosphoribosyl-dephospho-CoA synthase MdcB [Massilia brevitalea]
MPGLSLDAQIDRGIGSKTDPKPGAGLAPACGQAIARAPGIATARTEPDHAAFCQAIARHAMRSLYAELTLYPKPGLVSLVDNGSHDDMTAATFMRSLFALRHYFVHITRAGMEDAPFATLQRLGIDAENRMLRATGGINTHRGAVFCLGLLCAAIGNCRARGVALRPGAIRATLLMRWAGALAAHLDPGASDSHGAQAGRRHGVGGARQEAALGLPSVFELALPVLRNTLAAGRGMRRARVDALFALMAHISDTNLYHRGGKEGALTVRRHAQAFVARGGTANDDWEAQALACHHAFVAARLSPGGAADLLAAACLLYAVCAAQAPGMASEAGTVRQADRKHGASLVHAAGGEGA